MAAGSAPHRKRLTRARVRLLARRICVALAAACFVAAFSIAALAPFGLTLGGGVYRLGGDPSAWSGRAAGHDAGFWRMLLSAFLARPAWLVPAMLGLVSTGLAVTLGRVGPKAGRLG